MPRFFTTLALMTLCLTLTGCGGGGSGPGDVAAGFMKAAAAGDADKAKQYISPADRQGPGAEALPMMVAKVKAMTDEKKGLKSVKVVKEDVTGDTANVTLEMKFGDGTTETDDTKLQRVDGKWYIGQS